MLCQRCVRLLCIVPLAHREVWSELCDASAWVVIQILTVWECVHKALLQGFEVRKRCCVLCAEPCHGLPVLEVARGT
jgi:hypothetical protein